MVDRTLRARRPAPAASSCRWPVRLRRWRPLVIADPVGIGLIPACERDRGHLPRLMAQVDEAAHDPPGEDIPDRALVRPFRGSALGNRRNNPAQVLVDVVSAVIGYEDFVALRTVRDRAGHKLATNGIGA